MNYIFKKSVSRKESRIDLFFQGAPKSVKLLVTHVGIGNNSWSFQNSNSLKNWWWEIFTYPISTFRCRNCRSSESDYFSILNFIQSSGRTCKTLIKVWKMFLCEFRRLRPCCDMTFFLMSRLFSSITRNVMILLTQLFDFMLFNSALLR